MRLVEDLPKLPPNEGYLWAHPTGGEHATKYIGTEKLYNRLRAGELETLAVQPVVPLDREQFADMLQGDEHEVVIIDRLGLPQERKGIRGLAAGAIAQRTKLGKFDKRIKVTELVVHPDLRRRQIASFMLNRVTQLEDYGSGEPTELVIDTSVYRVEDWFREKLIEAGFRHADEDGSPAMWLPGNYVYLQGNLDDPAVVEQVLAPMPSDWNGHFELYPETDPQTQVFRAGQLLGKVRRIENPSRYDDEIDARIDDFKISDASDSELDVIEGLTRKQALIALLNNYQLIKTQEIPNPQKWGMKLDHLTPEVAREILDIYFKVGMGEAYKRERLEEEADHFAQQVPEDLASWGASEWRYGSRLTMHSKIWVIPDHRGGDVIRFIFDPNLEDPLLEEKPEIRAIETTFEERIARFLQEKGLGIPIQK